MDALKLPRVTLPEISLDDIRLPFAESADYRIVKNEGYYILSGGGRYLLADGSYYTLKKII